MVCRDHFLTFQSEFIFSYRQAGCPAWRKLIILFQKHVGSAAECEASCCCCITGLSSHVPELYHKNLQGSTAWPLHMQQNSCWIHTHVAQTLLLMFVPRFNELLLRLSTCPQPLVKALFWSWLFYTWRLEILIDGDATDTCGRRKKTTVSNQATFG